MNTGIQDSYNLAWKMALVVQGKTDERLLKTYNKEVAPHPKANSHQHAIRNHYLSKQIGGRART